MTILDSKYPYLEIVDTPHYGKAVKCHKNFRKGEIVFSYKEGILMDVQTQHSLQIRPGLFLEHPIAGYVQHSCDPNCWVSETALQFICRKSIGVGDMIQMDYEQTEDVLFQAFECGCGSPVCRGKITGKLIVDS